VAERCIPDEQRSARDTESRIKDTLERMRKKAKRKTDEDEIMSLFPAFVPGTIFPERNRKK